MASVIANFVSLVGEKKTQTEDHVNMRLISQLIKGISRVLQESLKYFSSTVILTIATRHSQEIWAVKLRFLLIYENMLRNIATTSSECTAKHGNKAGYNIVFTVPDLIDFLSDNWKEIRT